MLEEEGFVKCYMLLVCSLAKWMIAITSHNLVKTLEDNTDNIDMLDNIDNDLNLL